MVFHAPGRPAAGDDGYGTVALGVALAALAAMMPAPATAADRADATRSVTVRHIDPSLTSPAAATRLLTRLDKAALEVCGASGFSLSDVKQATRRSRCWQDAMADAVRRLDNPLLAAAFDKGRRQ